MVNCTDFPLENAIRKEIEESDEELTREDFFIATKLWNTYHSKEMVNDGIYNTLRNLSINYLDILYIHWPVGFKETIIQDPFPKDNTGNLLFSDVHYLETYRAIEDHVETGAINSIGLCNFSIVSKKFV
jgi:diketogulonate reductase-like aldo/keto reductase